MTAPLILLPPSEGKAARGRGRPFAWGDGPLGPTRVAVRDALLEAMQGSEPDREALLGVKGAALAEATSANLALVDAPARPAIERYTGVLYEALDAASLSATDRRRLNRQVLILSGLFGAVAPNERIPAYKLKMGAKLPGGPPARRWRPVLTDLLAERAARGMVWDLLPNEHAAAWRPPASLTRVSVRFVDVAADGTETTVSHWNKLLKGALVRWVLATGADGVEALTEFEHPAGYVFDPEATTVRAGLTTAVLRRGPGSPSDG